ncbi:MAG: metal-sensitive transcriptional regulator [Actinobacteria bacterium]|nr:metal-sensitive transcriptional regulator [Actinomycetota bacterium]
MTLVLHDPDQIKAIHKRVKRAQGQIVGITRMLEEGRTCEEIVTQMSAVSKAINTAAISLISASLIECLESDHPDTEAISARLQKLFLTLA